MRRNAPLQVAWLVTSLAGLVAAATALADDTSPVGRWVTVDDDTHRPKAVVRIWEEGGQLQGRIEKLFRQPGEDPDPTCDKCTDSRKDQRVIGMVILRGLTRDGDEWSGGRILDPENGKEYRCYIEGIDGGRRLKVRGYIGFSLLGRTQYWERVDESREVAP